MSVIPRLADVPLADCEFMRYFDLAATKPTKGGSHDPDYTAGCWLAVTMGRTPDVARGTWYVLNSARIRDTPKAVEDFLWSTHEHDEQLLAECGVERTVPVRVEMEGGASGKSLIDQLQRGRFAGVDFKGVRPKNGKRERAQPAAIAAEAGHIHVVDGSWLEDWLSELELFPDGAHDDQVDAFSGAFAELAKLVRVSSGDAVGVIPKGARDDDDEMGDGVWQVSQ